MLADNKESVFDIRLCDWSARIELWRKFKLGVSGDKLGTLLGF